MIAMHKCLKCGAIYDDDAPELLRGCSVCGSKYFLYYKDESNIKPLSKKEIKEIEEDIKDIVKEYNIPAKSPVIFDIESIVVEAPGKYRLNLDKLFNEKAVVVKVMEGKYFIDLSKLRR